MLEYCFDDLGLVYEADYLHSSFTLGAGERINLNLLLFIKTSNYGDYA